MTIEEMRTEREMVAAQLIHLKEQREQLDASVTHLTGRYRLLDQEIGKWAQAEMARQQEEEAKKPAAPTPEVPLATGNPFDTLKQLAASETNVTPINKTRKRGKK